MLYFEDNDLYFTEKTKPQPIEVTICGRTVSLYDPNALRRTSVRYSEEDIDSLNFFLGTGINKMIGEMFSELEVRLEDDFETMLAPMHHSMVLKSLNINQTKKSGSNIVTKKWAGTTSNDSLVKRQTETEFDVKEAKLDKLDDLEAWVKHSLGLPLKVKDNFWGIDDDSIRQMQIRINMSSNLEKYQVNVMDFYGESLETPRIVRLENIVGQMLQERKHLDDFVSSQKDLIESKKTVKDVEKIRFDVYEKYCERYNVIHPREDQNVSTQTTMSQGDVISRMIGNHIWE